MPAISITPGSGVENPPPPGTPPLPGVRILAPVPLAFPEIFPPAALQFLPDRARRFEPRRRELVGRRVDRQREFDAGAFPGFLKSTADVRGAEWRVAPLPRELIYPPGENNRAVGRKKGIKALNS